MHDKKSIQEFKTEFQKRAKLNRENRKRRRVAPEPRYDDVFFEGLEHLNKIASGEIDG